MNRRSKKFKALFRDWNEKLEKSGFKDIENMRYAEPKLKVYERASFSSVCPSVAASTLNYYTQAEALLEVYPFQNPIHKTIWQLHSDGLSIREIATLLNSDKYKKSNVANVINHIKRALM